MVNDMTDPIILSSGIAVQKCKILDWYFVTHRKYMLFDHNSPCLCGKIVQ